MALKRSKPVRLPNLGLVSQNVSVAGRRTSIRLESYLWVSLDDVCRKLGLARGDVATMVDKARCEVSLTSAMRVFILAFFRGEARNRDGKADALLLQAIGEVQHAGVDALAVKLTERRTASTELAVGAL